jgi:hypothetical protein
VIVVAPLAVLQTSAKQACNKPLAAIIDPRHIPPPRPPPSSS